MLIVVFLKDQCWGHCYTSSMLINDLLLHVDNHIYELLTLMIVIAFNQVWTILKLGQTGGKFLLTPLSVNLYALQQI